MTESAVQDAPAEATAPEEQGPVFPNDVAKSTFNLVNELTDKRNSYVARINAIKGDADELRSKLEEASENPKAVQARARRDEAKAALDAALEELHSAVDDEVLATMRDAEGSAKEIEENIKELDGQIKPATTLIKRLFGEELAKHLKPLERLKGFSTRGSGAGGRRIRGFKEITVVWDSNESEQFENFATAAKSLDMETADLQAGFFKAAGTDDPKKAPNEVEWKVEWVDVNEDKSETERYATVKAVRTDGDDSEPEAGEEDNADNTAEPEAVNEEVAASL